MSGILPCTNHCESLCGGVQKDAAFKSLNVGSLQAQCLQACEGVIADALQPNTIPDTLQFFVATSNRLPPGNDTNTGLSPDEPLLTLDRAFELLRQQPGYNETATVTLLDDNGSLATFDVSQGNTSTGCSVAPPLSGCQLFPVTIEGTLETIATGTISTFEPSPEDTSLVHITAAMGGFGVPVQGDLLCFECGTPTETRVMIGEVVAPGDFILPIQSSDFTPGIGTTFSVQRTLTSLESIGRYQLIGTGNNLRLRDLLWAFDTTVTGFATLGLNGVNVVFDNVPVVNSSNTAEVFIAQLGSATQAWSPGVRIAPVFSPTDANFASIYLDGGTAGRVTFVMQQSAFNVFGNLVARRSSLNTDGGVYFLEAAVSTDHAFDWTVQPEGVLSLDQTYIASISDTEAVVVEGGTLVMDNMFANVASAAGGDSAFRLTHGECWIENLTIEDSSSSTTAITSTSTRIDADNLTIRGFSERGITATDSIIRISTLDVTMSAASTGISTFLFNTLATIDTYTQIGAAGGTTTGLNVESASIVTISVASFVDNASGGVVVNNGSVLVWRGGSANANVGAVGLRVSNDSALTLIDTVSFDSNGLQGVIIENSSTASLQGTHSMSSNGSQGILVTDSSTVSIPGAVTCNLNGTAATTSGMLVSNGSTVSIRGSIVCDTNDTSNIYVTSGSTVAVEDATLVSCDSAVGTGGSPAGAGVQIEDSSTFTLRMTTGGTATFDSNTNCGIFAQRNSAVSLLNTVPTATSISSNGLDGVSAAENSRISIDGADCSLNVVGVVLNSGSHGHLQAVVSTVANTGLAGLGLIQGSHAVAGPVVGMTLTGAGGDWSIFEPPGITGAWAVGVATTLPAGALGAFVGGATSSMITMYG